MKFLLAFALAVISCTTSVAGFVTQYKIYLFEGASGVSGIIKFESLINGGGASWPDFAPGEEPTVIDQIFPSDTPRLEALLVGLAYGQKEPIYGPPVPSTKHVVLFMSKAAVAEAKGTEFSDLFAGYSEDDLASWIEIVSILGAANAGQDVFDDASAKLDKFSEDAKSLSTDPAVSAWFKLPLPGNPATEFGVVSFSQGTQIGRGAALQFQTGVPEPGTFAVVAIGGVALALVRRRRSI